MWFKYTPTTNTTLEIDTVGSDFNSSVSVWTGVAHPLTQVGCGLTVSVSVTAGMTYYIRASGGGGATGNLTINVKTVALLANNDLANATVIGSLPYSSTQSTMGATPHESGETLNSCGWNDTSSVWYKYTSVANTILDINISSSDFNSNLSVWTGTTHPLTLITC